MKRILKLGPLLLVVVLAACGTGQSNLVSSDACYVDWVHGFRDRDGIQNGLVYVHNQMLRPDAPPGCSSQASINYADGPAAIAMKTVLPAAIQAGGLVGYGAVLRPPQYNSNMSVSAGGAQFAAGAVTGGVASNVNTNANVNRNAAQGGAAAATARGGNGYGGSANLSSRIADTNNNTNHIYDANTNQQQQGYAPANWHGGGGGSDCGCFTPGQWN